MTLRVVELFSGIGAQRMALMQAGIPHEVVAICEINKHSLASYRAIYGDCPNLGDITKVQALPPCDLVTYSFPCQDLSLAGKRKGMGEGTRSGLVWEVVRLIESCEERERPEWLLMENVPQVLTSPLWPDLLDRLTALGYRNKWAKLDSSRFGSAQKRARAFMLSRLDAEPPDLPQSTDAPARCIRDIMEPQVGERYIRRIPLDRVKWREPLAGYHHPQSEGLDMPLLDAGDPKLETRRIAAEDSLAPTLRCGVPVRVVSENEEARARALCDKADNVRMAPKGEKSIGTATQDGVRLAVSPEEQRRQAQAPGLKVVADWKRGGLDIANRLYSSSSSPALMTHGGGDHHVKVADHIEPAGPVVVAEDTAKAYGCTAKVYSSSSSPTLRAQVHGLQNQPKVADHVEASSTPVASIDGETFYSRKMLYSSSSSCPTIRTFHSGKDMVKVVDGADPIQGDLVVRVLTPLECWRLMGFPDWAYERASKVSSETQLYNQAGNSIVVQVLEAIFKAMQERPKGGQATLERWGA